MRERIGRYIVDERIGVGGMAEVFAGEMVGADGFVREVAIKRVRPQVSRASGFARRFVREARLACMLAHPNIVDVIDFDRDTTGRHFLVMELIHGVDLARLVDTGALPLTVSAFIVTQMLRGLAHAHERMHQGRYLGVVHRDISPQNVMLSVDGEVKLVDFGLASALVGTHSSLVASLTSMPGLRSKVGYTSPEQIEGLEADARADIFATGVVLYELVTGRRLFAAPTPMETVDWILRRPIAAPHVVAPHVPRGLSEVCMTMLAREREARFASARQALDALVRIAARAPRSGSMELAELLGERFPRSGYGGGHEPAAPWPGAEPAPADQYPSGQARGAEVHADAARITPGAPRPARALAPEYMRDAHHGTAWHYWYRGVGIGLVLTFLTLLGLLVL